MKNNKNNCEDHPTTIDGFGNGMRMLADEVGDLRYKELAEFMYELGEKLRFDSRKDKEAGRSQLAFVLERSASHIMIAHKKIESAWRICEFYMESDE